MAAYPRTRIIFYSVVALAALAADLISKSVAFERLGGVGQQGPWLIDGWLKFKFHSNLNLGALWGMGQGFAPGFAALSIAAVAGIIYWLFFRGAASSLWLTIALALVTGGALGNCYDRLGLHGICFPDPDKVAMAVRDFLRFRFGTYEYPIFNIADSFLVAGAIMLMIQSLKSEPSSDAPATVPSSKEDVVRSPYDVR